MNLSRIALAFCFFSLCLLCTPQAQAQAEVGKIAPRFSLTDIHGQEVNLEKLRGEVVVLEWFNPFCPFVKKHYGSGHMQQLQEEYVKKGVKWFVIDSTNPSHQNFSSPEKLLKTWQELGIKSSALLVDPTGKVGRSYQAKTTPHMFIIDKDGKLAYQGAIDNDTSATSNPKEALNYMRQGLDEVLSGKSLTVAQTPPYGCSVKYGES